MVQFADNLEIAITESTEAVQEQRQPLWRPRIVHVRADITELDDATIYFGLLKSNPTINFQLLLAQGCPVLDAWLAPFGALRIDQIFFLYAWSSVPRVSYKVTQLAGLSLGIATPGDNYTRWLTTFSSVTPGQVGGVVCGDRYAL